MNRMIVPLTRLGPHATALIATAFLTLGCAGEAGSQTQIGLAGAERNVPQAAGTLVSDSVATTQGEIVDSSPLGSLAVETLRQRLLLVPRPPEIAASSVADIPDTLGFAARAAQAKKPHGGRWVEAAQIGLLFGAPEGKAFLTATEGRALVRGEPAESCPALHVASARTDRAATEGALRACLNEIAVRPGCDCRVIAQGDRLFAKRDDFAYAIGVGTHLVDTATRRTTHMTSEERVVEGRPGARHVWVLGVAGPYGLLQVEPDGRAAFILSKDGARYDGTHKADGLRRGRIARRAYLTSKTGEQMIILVGYEESELEENLSVLTAWNPYGEIDLKKAEAE